MFARDLDRLLKPYPPSAAALYRDLVTIMRDIRPDFTFKVSQAWQTVNFHHPKLGFIAAVCGTRDHRVALVFQDGRLLDHPRLTDDGKVKNVRWIPFTPGEKLPVDEIAILLAESVALRN
jgi:hypothetical protein